MQYSLLFCILLFALCAAKREFRIDYENNQFLKDGKPFRYIAGSIHYFRVPSYYWRDRLTKMRAAGLNAIEFYIPWNVHELTPGVFNFEGEANLTNFLEIGKKTHLVSSSVHQSVSLSFTRLSPSHFQL